MGIKTWGHVVRSAFKLRLFSESKSQIGLQTALIRIL